MSDENNDPAWSRYSRLADTEVVALAQRGEESAAEYLLHKYRSLVQTSVRSHAPGGPEGTDLMQIGMIGLWQAIVDFSPAKAPSFRDFAQTCVHHHLSHATRNV
jgi:RNA polymerase sporulation-specific sigma factor